MTPESPDWLINEARTVLVLLTAGKIEEATQTIKAVEFKLGKRDASLLDVNVRALWDQVRIASGNISDKKYLEQVKDELNRVTFEFSHKNE